MICKSKHNSALNQVEKVSMRTKKSFGGTRKRKLLKGQDKEFISENVMTSLFFRFMSCTCARSANKHVQVLAAERTGKLVAPQVYLKF